MVPSLLRRLVTSLLVVSVIILLGGSGLFALGRGHWTLGESMYMAVIAVSTVGFGELPGQDHVPGARAFTVAVILSGLGAVAYFQSALTAFVVQVSLGDVFRKNRMKRQIEELRDHAIVAGAGSTGRNVIQELVSLGKRFVVIDSNGEHLERLSREEMSGNMLYLVGDATEDQMLLSAGIARADGLIAALTHDKDNLYVTLSARTLNARARIVTKVIEQEAVAKMIRAGANATVSPNTIGGRRLASELVRPEVVEFLDQMVRDRSNGVRFHDAVVPETSPFVGKTLADLPLPAPTQLLLVAVRQPDQGYVYNPPSNHVVRGGMVLIALGDKHWMVALEKDLG